MAPPSAPYNPTIMTPDQSAYVSKEGTGDNFEDEPPLMEGTVKPPIFRNILRRKSLVSTDTVCNDFVRQS